MSQLTHLFENNRAWAKKKIAENPSFFSEMAKGQSPKYLWFGCSDSRVPPNEILDLPPGEIFVHRNIANLFIHTDISCLSVLEYAVNVLKVEHIIVCGHYGCGGVCASTTEQQFGVIDNWLRTIRDVEEKHHTELVSLENKNERINRLIEYNVMSQVKNIKSTTIVKNALEKKQPLSIHGWVYDLSTGLVKEID